MKTLLLLLMSSLAMGRESLVVTAKSFCHAHDGAMECRSSDPLMEFPEAKDPERLEASDDVICSFENGKLDCAGPRILRQRVVPKEVTGAEQIRYWHRRLCGVVDGHLTCVDDKGLKVFVMEEADGLEAVQVLKGVLVGFDKNEIRIWEENGKVQGRVSVDVHDQMVVLDAIVDRPDAMAFYCYAHAKTKVTCRVGTRTVTKTFKRPVKRLVDNSSRFCVVQSVEGGEQRECFHRYSLLTRLSFVPDHGGEEKVFKEIDGTGTCGIDASDNLLCWYLSELRMPKGFNLKGAHFTRSAREDSVCLASSDGYGCTENSYLSWGKREPFSWAYDGQARCTVDENGYRKCTCLPDIFEGKCKGLSFTFEPEQFGKVLDVRTSVTDYLNVLSENGLHSAFGAHFEMYKENFYPHQWKTDHPILLGVYGVADGDELLTIQSSPAGMKPWPLPIQHVIAGAHAGYDCFLNPSLKCFDAQGTLQVEDANLFTSIRGGNGFICVTNESEILCRNMPGDIVRKYSFQDFHPALGSDRTYYYLRHRSGEIRRYSLYKETYEVLHF